MINNIQPIVSKSEPKEKPKPVSNNLSFNDAIDNLLVKIQEDYDKRTYSGKNMNLSLKKGRKFIKIITNNSVWGFVAKADGMNKGVPMKAGDVLKAAGWAAPAKHTRGNIFDNNQDYFSWTGPNYL